MPSTPPHSSLRRSLRQSRSAPPSTLIPQGSRFPSPSFPHFLLKGTSRDSPPPKSLISPPSTSESSMKDQSRTPPMSSLMRSSPPATSLSPPSPDPSIPPVAPFQRLGALGQGPNGTTGSSQALGTTFFSGVPSAGSIVVNMACFPYFPPMQTDPRLLGPSISAQPTPSNVPSVASMLDDRVTPVCPYDLVSSYNDLLIFFIC